MNQTAAPPDEAQLPGAILSTGGVRSELGAILAAAAVVIGARVGEHLVWAAPTLLAGMLVVGPAVLAVRLVRSQSGRRAAGLLLLGVLGALSMGRALAGLDGDAARLAATETETQVTVRLAADPQGRWTGIRVPARLEAVGDGGAGQPVPGTRRRSRGNVLVVGTREASERLRVLEAGESAVLLGYFRPLGAGEERWRWRHVGAVFEAHDLLGAGRAEPGVLRAANGLRHRVLAGGEGLGETDRVLVAGFLVGDDRGLPAQVAGEFRAAGLSHLLVVSGANVTLVLAFVAPFLRRFGLFGRLAGGLAVLVLFAAMTRFEPSVLRAAGMSGLGLLAGFLGRPVAGLRLLALAVTGLVIIDPFLVHSLGFGLSCGASRRDPAPRPAALAAPSGAPDHPRAVGGHGGGAGGRSPVRPPRLRAAAPHGAAGQPCRRPGRGGAEPLGTRVRGRRRASGTAFGSPESPAGLLQIPTAALSAWIRLVARTAARAPVMVGVGPALVGAAIALLWWYRRRPGPVRCGREPLRRGSVGASLPGLASRPRK